MSNRRVNEVKPHDAFCECRRCCLMWEGVESSMEELEDDYEEYDDEDELDAWAREIADE